MRDHLRTVRALMRRGLNEILRVPVAALPGVLAPTIFMLGLAAVFGKAASLPAYEGRELPRVHRAGGDAAGRGVHGRGDRASTSPATSSAAGLIACCSRRPRGRCCWRASSRRRACARCCRRRSCSSSRSRSACDWPGLLELGAGRGARHGARRRDGVLRDARRAALSHPAGGAAHADGLVHPRAVHDVLRAARAACPAGCARSRTSTPSRTCSRACGRGSSAT